MKKYSLLCLLGFSMMGMNACAAGSSAKQVPTITAHAGAMDTKANTPDSVKACIAAAKTGNIEVDVRFLGDGTPVLGHDEEQKGACSRLEDCLALLAQSQAGINLDLKEWSNIPGVVALVRQYGLEERAFFTGVGLGEIDAVKGSGLTCYLNCAPKAFGLDAKRLVRKAKDCGVVGLNIHYRLCTQKLMDEAHAAGLAVSVWTVDNEPAMQKMIRYGVDNITTRHPDVCEGLLHAD